MSIDERLHRDLERIASPGDPSGVYEELLHRRSRKAIATRWRRAGLSLLAVATSVTIFLGLWVLFGGPRRPSTSLLPPVTGQIAFVTFDDSGGRFTSKIFLANPDGSDRLALLEVPEPVLRLQWSPDGTELAVSSGESLWIVDIGTGQEHEVNLGGWSAYGVSWSPDGTRFVAADDRPGPDSIYVMNRDGTERSALIQGDSLGWTSWSPNGEQILFVGPGPTGARQAWDIYVMNADGSRVRNLTQSDTVDLEPSWSPDGSLILFRSRRDVPPGWSGGDAPDEIYVMLPDGSNPVRLTTDAATDQNPVWSPDGTRIAFTSYKHQEPNRVYSIRADGTDRIELLPRDDVLTVAWQPFPRTADTGTPSVSGATGATNGPDGRDVASELTGVGRVCGATTVDGDFLGAAKTKAYVFEPEPEGGCDGPNESFQYVGVSDEAGTVFSISEELTACLAGPGRGCWAFAAPDIDRDGTSEIAIGIGTSGGSVLFELYAVAGETIRRLGFECSNCNSGTFAWGRPGGHAEGIYCLPPASRQDFVMWNAERTDAGDRYALVELTVDVKGDFLVQTNRHDSSVPYNSESLPSGGGADFCGAPTSL